MMAGDSARGLVVWKSLVWGRGLVEMDPRWRVGDGSTIEIYNDKWLPRPTSFKIVSPKKATFRSPHTLCWHYAADGIYSINSGYRLAMSLDGESGPSNLQAVASWWKAIWCLCWKKFWAANEKISTGCPPSFRLDMWKAPCEGFLKINTNAAIDRERQVVGVGIIVQNHLGRVIASSSQWISASYSPLTAEAVAVLRGIALAVATGLVPFVLETDTLGLVNLVKAGMPNQADVGLVIGDIIGRLREVPASVVGHVTRKRNVVSHTLAKLALNIVEDLLWMEEFTEWRDAYRKIF
ncbi:hypothetical protein Dsin_028883 [Dipteronia sinensis]|uniref:RNase H type-1 domain-containing protein n=1 Tax=Dipteronia sinensis TaxID=43782 RepID=A0AAD9ZSQ6_9ROSI|nr:hypothetical protein Dsin_028883 [Dipteronia sinensis]